MTENETTPGDEFADRRLLALPSSPPPIPKPNDRPARVSGNPVGALAPDGRSAPVSKSSPAPPSFPRKREPTRTPDDLRHALDPDGGAPDADALAVIVALREREGAPSPAVHAGAQP